MALILPEQIVARSDRLFADPAGNIWLIYGFGLSLLGLGGAALSEPAETAKPAPAIATVFVVACTLLSFLALSTHLRDWWIDDAGITFAYSRSLVEGHGLVAQPWLPPEEGYSSSVWMLLLSLAARLGADIPLAAKGIGIFCSAAAIVICTILLARETRSPLAIVLCGVALSCGPTVVWAVSGQEHALQSLILLSVVLCAYALEHWRWPVAVLLAVFVLTRPEAPIIVITVFAVAVYLTLRSGGRLVNAGDAAIALVPFAAFLALMAFRMGYFGDLFPNPFYAKSTGTSLTGLFNPLGGGWGYVLGGLRSTALVMVLALIFALPARPWPAWLIIAFAVLAGQAFFVIWAKGDWMSQYRFLMPVLPVLLLVACLGLQGLGKLRGRLLFCVAAVLIVMQTTVVQLAGFKQSPTTPLAVVIKVGDSFRDLADRLGIEDPLLAHHDAGGITYHRMVRLLDLGGLVDRSVAKHMNDKAFMVDYIVTQMQPDFVFGARNFAAATGFSDTDAFLGDYVALEFRGASHMNADLTYIRRARVVPAEGVVPVYDNDRLMRVIVDPGA